MLIHFYNPLTETIAVLLGLLLHIFYPGATWGEKIEDNLCNFSSQCFLSKIICTHDFLFAFWEWIVFFQILQVNKKMCMSASSFCRRTKQSTCQGSYEWKYKHFPLFMTTFTCCTVSFLKLSSGMYAVSILVKESLLNETDSHGIIRFFSSRKPKDVASFILSVQKNFYFQEKQNFESKTILTVSYWNNFKKQERIEHCE